MSDQSAPKTEWTAEDVVKAVTDLVKKRYGLSFDAYVELVKNNYEQIDRCRDSDILGLLNLIGVGPEVLAA